MSMGTSQHGLRGRLPSRAPAPSASCSASCSASRARCRLPPSAAADSSSDIPGVPLSPGVVVGPLGGSIYDVGLPPRRRARARVILASLTGSAGTDFDLYLFDGSATTVVTNQGVVAKSTGPTSTESLSYATPVGGRFYIDLNSATAAVGTYTLVVQVIRGSGSGRHARARRRDVRARTAPTVAVVADRVRQPLRPGPDGVQRRRDHVAAVAALPGRDVLDLPRRRRHEDALGEGRERRRCRLRARLRRASCSTPSRRA